MCEDVCEDMYSKMTLLDSVPVPVPQPLPNARLMLGANCTYCNKAGDNLSRCAKCKVVWYCNVVCQRQHWNEGHRDKCKPDALKQVDIDKKSLSILKESTETKDIVRHLLDTMGERKKSRGESMAGMKVIACTSKQLTADVLR